MNDKATPRADWFEVPVFIHGITPEPKPESHAPLFADFLRRVNAALTARGKPTLTEPGIMVEWGWEGSHGVDRDLAAAEDALAQRIFRVFPPRRGLGNPLHRFADEIRRYFIYGFADLAYYTAAAGQKAIRANVFDHLGEQIDKLQAGAGKGQRPISLTFITHSAGTVIGHDFLYYLFETDGGLFGLGLEKARKLVRKGALRVRRLFTMGSPITPLVFRDDAAIRTIKNGGCLDGERIGLRTGDGFPNPRWVNIWDRDDIFSYPLAPLYCVPGDGDPLIVDVHFDLGPTFPKVHRAYWESVDVVNTLADAF